MTFIVYAIGFNETTEVHRSTFATRKEAKAHLYTIDLYEDMQSHTYEARYCFAVDAVTGVHSIVDYRHSLRVCDAVVGVSVAFFEIKDIVEINGGNAVSDHVAGIDVGDVLTVVAPSWIITGTVKRIDFDGIFVEIANISAKGERDD